MKINRKNKVLLKAFWPAMTINGLCAMIIPYVKYLNEPLVFLSCIIIPTAAYTGGLWCTNRHEDMKNRIKYEYGLCMACYEVKVDGYELCENCRNKL